MLDWNKLLNGRRRKAKNTSTTNLAEFRTEFERDYDRLLFSTPLRRLADKTQVFPLEINDSVRTRLTHSHEVSNLCRSIATHLVFNKSSLFPEIGNLQRTVPALLAAIGLAHDFGNPPFGHQGEKAIQYWMKQNANTIFENEDFLKHPDHAAMKEDFLKFDGNAQTFRLVTKLQIINDNYGLNLTFGTLSALLKYPVSSIDISGNVASSKKLGFFQSEKKIVEDVWRETGLSKGIRHPLTYIMEACDDIAYSILDIEDAVKKGLFSYYDLIAFLSAENLCNNCAKTILSNSENDHKEFVKAKLSSAELNDVSMQKFRVFSISETVQAVLKSFSDNINNILDGTFSLSLIEASEAKGFIKSLKTFAYDNAYRHKSVLEIELKGFHVIQKLMTIFWKSIVNRADKNLPIYSYVYSRISENYRRAFDDETNILPTRYKELQLLTDMISGMTDSFAIKTLEEIEEFEGAQMLLKGATI